MSESYVITTIFSHLCILFFKPYWNPPLLKQIHNNSLLGTLSYVFFNSIKTIAMFFFFSLYFLINFRTQNIGSIFYLYSIMLSISPSTFHAYTGNPQVCFVLSFLGKSFYLSHLKLFLINFIHLSFIPLNFILIFHGHLLI